MQSNLDSFINKIYQNEQKLINSIILLDTKKNEIGCYDQYDQLVLEYLCRYKAEKMVAIIIRRFDCRKMHNNIDPKRKYLFDTRFGFFQFIKFKFFGNPHVCSILPYTFFTCNFEFSPEDHFYPDAELNHIACYKKIDRCGDCTKLLLEYHKIHEKILNDLENQKIQGR